MQGLRFQMCLTVFSRTKPSYVEIFDTEDYHMDLNLSVLVVVKLVVYTYKPVQLVLIEARSRTTTFVLRRPTTNRVMHLRFCLAFPLVPLLQRILRRCDLQTNPGV